MASPQPKAPPIRVVNAREHNLKGVSVDIPRHQLVVFTGVSGGGKSSLVFDTIYQEGRRRFLETFSPYLRRFMPEPPRPKVDRIDHLGPVIALAQQGVSSNPRSTLGTTTEIYDLLRVLFARAAQGFSPEGKPLQQFTFNDLRGLIRDRFRNVKIGLWAPVVRQRRGHYAHLLRRLARMGYRTVRIDGETYSLGRWESLQLSRYHTHSIEVLIDTLTPRAKPSRRLETALRHALDMGKGQLIITTADGGTYYYSRELIDPETGFSMPLPDPNLFSFNLAQGWCPQCRGIGRSWRFNSRQTSAHTLQEVARAIEQALGTPGYFQAFFQKAAEPDRFPLDVPLERLTPDQRRLVMEGDGRMVEFYWKPHGYFTLRFEGLNGMVAHWDEEVIHTLAQEGWLQFQRCPACEGTRVRPEARLFRIADHHIGQLATMPIGQLNDWLHHLEAHLDRRARRVADELLPEIHQKVQFLLDTGLDYLHLHRPLHTLSGGELQRVRLAQYISSRMVRIIYILDEPSIGLHPADNHRMIASLQKLRDLGNSVLVVEHDRDTMLAADYIIDLGPGQGPQGGRIVAQGTPAEVLRSDTATAQYLRGERVVASLSSHLPSGATPRLVLRGARGHNLRGVDLHLPLGHFICITGRSGSGKSSLIMETLYPALARKRHMAAPPPLPFDALEGDESIEGVYAVDQSPIGRTARSIPATYIGVYNHIRDLFASLPAARFHGLGQSHFSFNVKGGRCETCKGTGSIRIETRFLPPTWVPCHACRGRRFQPAVLQVRYKGFNIHEVLEMSVSEALQLFEDRPRIARKLRLLEEVGLGYIRLGQTSPTLSGGESQRLKIVRALARRSLKNNIFLLDEPTTGLHFQDIGKLVDAFRMLTRRGNTVVAIEHNMEFAAAADYIIDLGPGTGPDGGRIVAAAPPIEIIRHPHSPTAPYLAPVVEQLIRASETVASPSQ